MNTATGEIAQEIFSKNSLALVMLNAIAIAATIGRHIRAKSLIRGTPVTRVNTKRIPQKPITADEKFAYAAPRTP